MQQIPSSNLLLLVTDPTCDCSIFPLILQEATEVKYILPILHDMPAEGRVEVKETSLRGSDFEKTRPASLTVSIPPSPTEHCDLFSSLPPHSDPPPLGAASDLRSHLQDSWSHQGEFLPELSL